MKRMYAWIAIGLLAAGCKPKAKTGEERAERTSAPAKAKAKANLGEIFLYGDVTIDTAPVPAVFAAPFPTRLENAGDGESGPPEAYVRARMCARDPAMQERVLKALRTWTKDPDYAGEGNDLDLADLLGACDTPNDAWCAWLIEGTRGTESPAVRDLFAVALAGCLGPAAEAAATGEGISAAAVAKWREDTTFSPETPEKPPRSRAELDRCVSDPDEPAIVACLEELMNVDRPAAAKAVQAEVFDDITWDEGKTAITALTLFPAAGALAAQLRAWKLIPAPPAGGDDPKSVTAEELMDDGGASYTYLRAADEDSPQAHAVALTEATARVRDLDGIVFDQRPPSGNTVEVAAYLGGKRYRAKFGALDVSPTALASFLNTIARDHGATTRFMLGTPDERDVGYLLIGPEAGLAEAVTAELLAPPPAR